MHNKDKEDWIDSVLHSHKGSSRAKPSPDLLAKIDERIDHSAWGDFSIWQSSLAIAAAILLLIGNMVVLQYFAFDKSPQAQEGMEEEFYSVKILSQYEIY